MKNIAALLLIVVSCTSLNAAEKLQPISDPQDWLGWALADLVQIPEPDRPFQKYLAIPEWGNEKWVPVLNFVMNTSVSHARTIQVGTPIANGWMVRYDIRRFVPQADKLAKTLETWDKLALQDPYFHVPDSNVKLGVSVIPPTLPPDQAVLLSNLSLSAGAVYRADWFIVKAMSTLNGGAYYDFRQVVRKPEKGTALEGWLSQRGLFVGTTQNIGGERRTAMFRSGVTGKPRRIDLYPTLSGGLGSITRDVKDGNIEAGSHPLRNLINFKDDGEEIIVAQPNGMLDYLLADANGNIVDEAPPDLVRDHTIPPPHTARLQPARSCISCHNQESEQGWMRVKNDVLTVISSKLNIFNDLDSLGVSTKEEAIDKLTGFYALDVENADGILQRARRDHEIATLRCCQGIQFPPDKSIVAEIGRLTTSIIHEYDYAEVTPQRAALELGYKVPEKWEGDLLETVLGPVNETVEVDPIIGFLRIGVPVNRTDWETVYQDALNIRTLYEKDPK